MEHPAGDQAQFAVATAVALIISWAPPDFVPMYAFDGDPLRDYSWRSIEKLIEAQRIIVGRHPKTGVVMWAQFRGKNGEHPMRRISDKSIPGATGFRYVGLNRLTERQGREIVFLDRRAYEHKLLPSRAEIERELMGPRLPKDKFKTADKYREYLAQRARAAEAILRSWFHEVPLSVLAPDAPEKSAAVISIDSIRRDRKLPKAPGRKAA
jgi:hypothetical protein